MKKILFISILLAFAYSAHPANALTSENVTVTQTGGVTVSGSASAEGTEDASAIVHSIITSGGSNTQVRINIETAADGESHATSVERILGAQERIDVRIRDAEVSVEEGRGVGVEAAVETEAEAEARAEASLAAQSAVFERLAAFFGKVLELFIF